MAMTGTTSPSPARWRRSRSTSSPTSPLRVPSIRILPAGPFFRRRAPVPVEPHHVAVLGQQHFRPPRDLRRDPGVPGQLAVLPMYRHEVLRPDQGQDEFELFLAAVARHMDVLHAGGDDLGPPPGDVVHHPADRLLVAGDLPGREHDDVVRVQLDVPVVVDRDARQRRLRLPLRPRAQADDVLTGSLRRRCP